MDESALICAFVVPKLPVVFKFDCQLEGTCVQLGLPSSPPLPPQPPPPPPLPYCEMESHKKHCYMERTEVAVFMPLATAATLLCLVVSACGAHSWYGRHKRRPNGSLPDGAPLLAPDTFGDMDPASGIGLVDHPDNDPRTPARSLLEASSQEAHGDDNGGGGRKGAGGANGGGGANSVCGANGGGGGGGGGEAGVENSLSSQVLLSPGAVSVPGGAAADPEISWRGLSYHMRQSTLLRPSSGTVGAGLWCLLGPSGAGKSTLLGALSGRKSHGRLVGEVNVNMRQASRHTRRRTLGYVTQDDVLPPTSTVEEQLRFHLALRTPELAREDAHLLVEKVLADVDLRKKARDFIGDGYLRGLSGGEKRRVSIAVELVVLRARGGGILLMDEPLTGLDSASARRVLDSLVALTGAPPPSRVNGPAHAAAHAANPGSLGVAEAAVDPEVRSFQFTVAPLPVGPAQAGVSGTAQWARRVAGPPQSSSVLLSVHQPTVRFMSAVCGVVVMAPGGRQLYCGPRRLPNGHCALSAHFDDGLHVRLRDFSPSAAEAILELIEDESEAAQARVLQIASSLEGTAGECGANGSKDGDGVCEDGVCGEEGVLRALRSLALRNARLMARHPLLMTTSIISTVVVSTLCAWAFNQMDLTFNNGVLQRLGLLVFLGAYFQFTALISLGMWREERILYFQERGAGCYGPFSYIVSRAFFDGLTMRVLPALICSAIIYVPTGLAHGQHGATKAYAFTAGLCLANLVSSAMINCIGILCPSTALATLISVLYALFTLLFCGILVNGNALQATLFGVDVSFEWLNSLSYLYYFCELVLTNEISDQEITIKRMWADSKDQKPIPYQGWKILEKNLKYFNGTCSRIIDNPGGVENMGHAISACWFDLYVPAYWFLGALLLSYLLLRFCVRDPH